MGVPEGPLPSFFHLLAGGHTTRLTDAREVGGGTAERLLVEALCQRDGGQHLRRRFSLLAVQSIRTLQEDVYRLQALLHGEVGYLR